MNDLQQVLDESRERNRVPGAAVGIHHRGRDIVAISGVTSVDDPLPVTPRTLFMIGSTSKTFTATALMRLVEHGKVSLEDRVLKHLPGFRLKSEIATKALTIRHLVTHSGGWDGDVQGDDGWGDDALEKFVSDLRKQPQLMPVGAVWSYNNSGFSVAGRIIEVVTKKPFETAVRELVIDPLGLKETFYSPVEVMNRRHVAGHLSTSRGPKLVPAFGIERASAPAGGIVSTVKDQLAYARFHLGDGRAADGSRVMRRKTLALMQSPLFPAGNFADHVGVSWMLRDEPGGRTVEHGGNISNLQISTFLMVPARGFAVTVLTNATTGRVLSKEMERWALEKFAGMRQKAPVILPATRSELSQYTGTFKSKLLLCDIAVRGPRLVMKSRYGLDLDELPDEQRKLAREIIKNPPKPVALALVAPDRVVTEGRHPARGEFLRNRAGGRVEWFRWGGRLLRRTA